MLQPASIALLGLLFITGTSPAAASVSGTEWLEPAGSPAPATAGLQQVADTIPDLEDLPAVAEGVENPLLPRGTFHLGTSLASTTIRSVHGDDGRLPLGGPFLAPALGVDQLPEMGDTELRFRDLMGPGSDWTLNLGSVRGRFLAQEQSVPVQVGYGVLDRLTVGVTLPFFRRRIHPFVRLAGEGATVGGNPGAVAAGDVNDFLSGSEAALAQLQQQVEAECAEGSSSRCQQGQELLERASGFVAALEAAYEEALVFPLRGTGGAGQLLDRWSGIRTELGEWDVTAPEDFPVAEGPLADETFASTFVDPVWGVDGFPRERVREYMELGDVEVHAVVGLLDLGRRAESLRIRSSLVASLRFPTGVADSLQTIAPMAPPRGVGGGGLRLVTDIVSAHRRLALLTVVDGWWFSEGEAVILAPDPNRLLGETGVARLPVDWQPGSTLQVAVTPRFHVTPGISLGLGYQFDRRGDHSMTAREEGSVPAPADGSGSTLHRLRGELRHHGFEGPVAQALPFRMELHLTYEGTVAGNGDLPVAERRIQMGARVFRSR